MVIVQSDSSPHIETDTKHDSSSSGTKFTGIQFDTKPTAIINGRQRPHEKALRNHTTRSMRNSSLDDSYLFHTHLERDANNLFLNIYDVNKQSNSIAAGLHERHYQYQNGSRQLETKISEFIDIKNKLLLKPDPIASSSSESNSIIDSTSPVPSSTNIFYKNRANSTTSTNDESESNEDETTDNINKVSMSNENLDNCILNLKSRSKVLASLSSDLDDEEDSIDNCAVLNNCDDFDRGSCSSRRETIIFKRPIDNENPCTGTVDDTTFVENNIFEFKEKKKDEVDDASKEKNSTDILVTGEIGGKITTDTESITSMPSVSRKNSADETSTKQNGYLQASNMACEVASLSSMTSNYSQFDFLNNQADKQLAARAPSPPRNQQLQKKVSNPLTSFFFPNSFFNRSSKKSAQQPTAPTHPSIPESPNKPLHSNNRNNKFDLITSSILGLKSKPSTSTDQQKSSLHSSSSSLSNPQAEPDRQSIRSNQSSTNLRSFFSGSGSMTSSASVHDFQPNSVLIFENRPSNLPAKSQQEALKHKQEYERMVEAAKRKELREKEIKVKKHEQQVKKEDFMANSLRIWNTEILTNWKEAKNSKRTRQLWWHGLPPSIRGKVWKLAIGNELGLSKDSYIYYKQRAAEKLETLSKNPAEKSAKFHHHESSVELIKLDVSRTFPQLCFFQRDGPYHEALHSVLGAYACFNPKIGYVQGMSFLTAILLLNMEAPDAFICLANLLKTKYLTACFNMDQTMMNRYFRVHQILLEHNLPKLHKHFEEQKVKPDLYLIEWIFTLFSKSLPLDVMSRVWDVFFRDQEEFLFRTALGILSMYKETLLEMDFIHIVQFLTKLPETINSTQLFKAIEKVNTNIDEDYFTFEKLMYQVVTAPGQSKMNATRTN